MLDSPDTLNARIGVLTRREVEARLLASVLAALCRVFDGEQVLAIVGETISQIARQQGAELAALVGGTGSAEFLACLEHWTRDDAMQLTLLHQDAERLEFDVTRCGYAEMYHALGIPELGALLSCNRDAALIAGFNPAASLTRAQTLLQGAPSCPFRYRFPQPEVT